VPFRAGSVADHLDTHGWLIGAFADGLHHADGVEVKWGRHPAGEQRAAWNRDPRPTLCVLVAGRFRQCEHFSLPSTSVRNSHGMPTTMPASAAKRTTSDTTAYSAPISRPPGGAFESTLHRHRRCRS
jgi:hypothetical protein